MNHRAQQAGVKPQLKLQELRRVSKSTHCYYCGHRFEPGKNPYRRELDHVIPLSRGGAHALSNLVAACHRCNHQKRDRTLAEWVSRWYQKGTSDAIA